MELTFITICDLTENGIILYSSDSIVDVLRWSPEEVVNHSCWEYFHPDEVAIAKQQHGVGIANDKAAIICYYRMLDRDGNYVGCEVVFTVVYNVLVGCISIYRRGLKSDKRAIEAPQIQRLFSTEPRDPRYHMLSHLSSKFAAPTQGNAHEPRAALFLNRFTRTLTIMYATDGLAELLGMTGEEMKGLSFYYLIQENCLHDAVHCLENAKANDSIAYLRFVYRNPHQDNRALEQQWLEAQNELDTTPLARAVSNSDEGGAGGVDISAHDANTATASRNPGLERRSEASAESRAVSSDDNVEPMDTSGQDLAAPIQDPDSRDSSGNSNQYTHEAVFGEPAPQHSSASSASDSAFDQSSVHSGNALELEAVVSCTSDGLVVCLRRAKAIAPVTAIQPSQRVYNNGLFAVPWSTNPIFPPVSDYIRQEPAVTYDSNAAQSHYTQPWTGHRSGPPTGSDFMNSIRDIAIFAWALVGINGSLAEYSSGYPRGESQPAAGIPIWRPQMAPNQQSHTESRTGPSST